MRKGCLGLLLLVYGLCGSADAQVQLPPMAEGSITVAGADCSVNQRCLDWNMGGVVSTTIRLNVATSGTFAFEASVDATGPNDGTWFAIVDDVNGASTATADGTYSFANPGYRRMRMRASAISGTATAVVYQGFSALRSTASLSGSAQGDGAVQDGASAAIEATVFDFTSSNPIATHLVDANGDAATIGGGTQYTEADTDASITGTALLFEGAANALVAAPGTAANGLLVDVSRVVGTVTVASHAVTNAGTFATQVDGAALTSLQIIDNVVFGAGTEAAALRVTLATDSTGVVSIDDNGGVITVDGSISCSNCTGSGASLVDGAGVVRGTDSVAPVGFIFDDTTPVTNTEGDIGFARMSAVGVPYSTLRDAAGNERGANVTANNELLVELGAGAASIGILGANSGVDIGDVTINNATIAVTQSGTWDEIGINDSGNSITVDGTVTITDGAGAVNVIVDSATLGTVVVGDGAGAMNVICDSGCSSSAIADDADFTDGTTVGNPIGGVAEAASPSTVTEGDFGWAAITLNRALKVTLFNSTGTELAVSADMTVGTAFGTTGPGALYSYKEFDGAALPTTTNVGTEEEANPAAVTLQGVQYAFLTNENGSKEIGKLEDDGHTTADYGMPVWTRRIDAAGTSTGSNAEYATINTDALGLLWTRQLDPCSGVAKSVHVVNMSTATTVEIANAVASEFWYICSVNLVAGAAQTIAIGHDDTDGCGSITAGLHGGATAATGWSFAANGGIALGNGLGTIMKSATANHYLCVITGQGTQISGTIEYVSAP